MTMVAAAKYRPDVSQFQSSYTDTAQNVLLGDGAYLPAPSLSELTAALSAKPTDAITVIASDGSVNIFAGTATKLWKLNNTTLAWGDVSGTAYSSSDDNPWCFGTFGDYVIAVNRANNPQVYQVGVDVVFRNLGGSPPRAGIVKVWGDFVTLMDLTANPGRVQWSGLNNAEFWTPGSQNSDYQQFPDGGTVQGSSEATNPIIFLEKAIYRGTFVPGSLEIFTFQKIHDKRGAKSQQSITSRGAFIFYCDEGGFFQISPDGQISTIGFEKLDRTIFTRLAASSISRIRGAVDPFFSRVYFALDFTGSGIFDTIVVYDWNIQEWTTIAVTTCLIFPLATLGYTLESLDSVSASLDALPFSLDAKIWQGGAPILGAFGPTFKMGSFNGPSLEATMITEEFGDSAGQVQRTTRTYAVIDTSNVYISIGQRFRRSDDFVWLLEQIPSTNTGQIRKNSRARFHRFKVRIPAGTLWTHLQGIDTEFAPAGFR
jgi:hypothetical protein